MNSVNGPISSSRALGRGPASRNASIALSRRCRRSRSAGTRAGRRRARRPRSGREEDDLGAALERVLDQRAVTARAEPAAAGGRQRGDADDLGHRADRLVLPAASRPPASSATAMTVSAVARSGRAGSPASRTLGRRVALGRALRPGGGPGCAKPMYWTARAAASAGSPGPSSRSIVAGGSGRAPAAGRAPSAAPLDFRRAVARPSRTASLVDPLERLGQAELALARPRGDRPQR